jgi:hypothetical protein
MFKTTHVKVCVVGRLPSDTVTVTRCVPAAVYSKVPVISPDATSTLKPGGKPAAL